MSPFKTLVSASQDSSKNINDIIARARAKHSASKSAAPPKSMLNDLESPAAKSLPPRRAKIPLSGSETPTGDEGNETTSLLTENDRNGLSSATESRTGGKSDSMSFVDRLESAGIMRQKPGDVATPEISETKLHRGKMPALLPQVKSSGRYENN